MTKNLERRALYHSRQRALSGNELPAGAGNVPMDRIDLFLEADQLPVVGMTGEGVAQLASQRNHHCVRAQRVAEHDVRAKHHHPTHKKTEQRRSDALSLPEIVDGDTEFETSALGI